MLSLDRMSEMLSLDRMSEMLSLDRMSDMLSLERIDVGVEGRCCFSGDLGGDGVGLWEPSIIKLRSLTEPGCIDCIRRWEPAFSSDRSGDESAMRFARDGTRATLSRARSLSAAWAD